MEHEERPKPDFRYAREQELTGYINYHTPIFLERINGLANLEVGTDEEGAFVTLNIREDPSDPRELTTEQAAGLMSWREPQGLIRARVKVKKIDDTLEGSQ